MKMVFMHVSHTNQIIPDHLRWKLPGPVLGDDAGRFDAVVAGNKVADTFFGTAVILHGGWG